MTLPEIRSTKYEIRNKFKFSKKTNSQNEIIVNHRFRLGRKAVPPIARFLKSVGVIYSSRRGTKKLSLHTLHEPARLVRKIGKNEEVKIAKSLLGKEIKFFIFLVDSKIVQAPMVLSGHFDGSFG